MQGYKGWPFPSTCDNLEGTSVPVRQVEASLGTAEQLNFFYLPNPACFLPNGKKEDLSGKKDEHELRRPKD